jgi:hypothetical protein
LAEQWQIEELCTMTKRRTANAKALARTYVVVTLPFPYHRITQMCLLAASVCSQNNNSSKGHISRRDDNAVLCHS